MANLTPPEEREDAGLQFRDEEASPVEFITAKFKQSFRAAETHSILRARRLYEETRKDDIVDFKTLKSIHGDDVKLLPKPTGPISASRYNTLLEFKKEELELQEVIQRGKQPWYMELAGFGTSLAAQVVDPTALVAGIGLSLGTGYAAKLGLLGTKAMAGALAGKRTATLGATIAENIAYGVTAEAAIVSPQAEAEGKHVDILTTYGTVVAAGFALPTALKGLSVAKKKIFGDPELGAKALNMIEQQIDAGKKVGRANPAATTVP
jgi:hypothetical protein